MPSVRVSTLGIMSINNIWRLILRRIFDPKNAGESDLYLIESNIEKYAKIVNEHNTKLQDAFGDAAFTEAVGRRGSVIDEIEYQIREMSKWRVADEKGEEWIEKKKFTFKEHNIDYRKVFQQIYPECSPTKSDYARAQESLRKNNEDNKELLN